MSLFSIPDWIFLCLFVVLGSVIIVTCIYFLVRHFSPDKVLKKQHKYARFFIGIFGVLYSVFLGFTVVNSQNHYKQIISQIDQEAYLSADLFRTIAVFPKETKIEMQKRIMEYLQSVIKDEWPLMQKKMESPITLTKLEAMRQPFYSFNPQTDQQKLWLSQAHDILSKQNSARVSRIYSSWESLGTFYWLALLIGGVLLISFLFFFGTENTWSHLTLNALFTAYFAFMIFVVSSLDNPFSDPGTIKPKSYEMIYNFELKQKGSQQV